jgi:hypothetical protein
VCKFWLANSGCRKCSDPDLLKCFESEHYVDFISSVLGKPTTHAYIPRTSTNLHTKGYEQAIELQERQFKTEKVEQILASNSANSLTVSPARRIRKVD